MTLTGPERRGFEQGVLAERRRIGNIIQGMKPGAEDQTTEILERVAHRINP